MGGGMVRDSIRMKRQRGNKGEVREEERKGEGVEPGVPPRSGSHGLAAKHPPFFYVLLCAKLARLFHSLYNSHFLSPLPPSPPPSLPPPLP